MASFFDGIDAKYLLNRFGGQPKEPSPQPSAVEQQRQTYEQNVTKSPIVPDTLVSQKGLLYGGAAAVGIILLAIIFKKK